MFENIEWIFFDVGSTLVDEHLVYEHTFRDIAEHTNLDYTFIYNEAIEYYNQNKKGDIELGIKYNLPKRKDGKMCCPFLRNNSKTGKDLV